MLSAEQISQGNRLRRRLCRRFYFMLIVLLVLQCAVVVFCPISLVWAAFAGLAVVILLSLYSRLSKVSSTYYKPLMEKSLSTRFQKFIAGDSGAFAQYNIDNASLVTMSSDDYRCFEPFSGLHNNVAFSWGAMHFENGYPTPRGRITFTKFCGSWLIFRRPITFSHPILVVSKKRGGASFSGGGDLRRVPMPDGEFNRRFMVFSTSENAVHYMLDDALQKRMLTIAASANGPILLGFEGQTMHLAVYGTPKSLNVPLFGSIDDYLRSYQQERVEWPKRVVETLWPVSSRR